MSSIRIDAFCPVGIGGTQGIDTTHLKIFVGGLLSNHTSKDLYDMFVDYGTIRESVVIPDRFRVRSRCYGFVTFVSHKSVSDVFRNCPILTKNGVKLTVVLASSNTKPRRAHFNVRHGTSGHKALPMVKEEENENEVGIYTDPSLFRTANIQPIAPAQFKINKNKNKNNYKHKTSQRREYRNKALLGANWPNEDIKKDYHNLKKVPINNGGPRRKNLYNNKSWKLTVINKEKEKKTEKKIEKKVYKKDIINDNDDEDIYSMCSRKWTPISYKRIGHRSIAGSGRMSQHGPYNPNNKEMAEKEKEKEKQDKIDNISILESPKRQRKPSGNSPYSPSKKREPIDYLDDDEDVQRKYSNDIKEIEMNLLRNAFKTKMESKVYSSNSPYPSNPNSNYSAYSYPYNAENNNNIQNNVNDVNNPWSPYHPSITNGYNYDNSYLPVYGNMNGSTSTPLIGYNMNNILPSSRSTSVDAQITSSITNDTQTVYPSYTNLTENVTNIGTNLYNHSFCSNLNQ